MITLNDVNTIEEAAAYLRLTPLVVTRLVRSGKIVSHKEGRTRTIDREDLLAYHATTKQTPTPANPFGLTERAAKRLSERRVS